MAPGLNLPPPSAGQDGSNGAASPAPAASSSSSARPQATVEDVDEVTNASASSSKPRFATGGIIYPPPDIRNTVDRTAALVAKRGTAIEARIKGDERANVKFAFLNDGDSYNAYYRAKIEAIRDGTGPLADAAQGSPAVGSPAVDGPGSGQLMRVDGQEAMEEEMDQQDAQRPTEPKPHLFSVDLPNISAVDLDVIKLTALFVARKGKAFSQQLLDRERNSNQFQFMRPQHSLFGLYSRMVEQYRLVLYPPTDLMEGLTLSAGSHKDKTGMGVGGARQHVLREAKQRADWEKWMDQKRKERVDQEEEEKAAFAEIDWQDFVVVATVEITEADQHIDLPVPMSLREVENMTMAQKKMAALIEEEEGASEDAAIEAVGLMDVEAARAKQAGPEASDEMQMDSGDEGDGGDKSSSGTRPAAAPASMKIRKDYVPKTLAERQREAAQQTTKCPVCGETVATSEMDEHVRIELLNPQYRQQRADIEARRAQQAALTTGADPSRFLKQFAGARTDIFGLQDQEVSAAKREEEERKRAKEREKVIWDGHAASRTRTRDDFNRPDMIESSMRDIQGRFKPKDTESIGPQIGGAYPPAAPGEPDASASGAAGFKRPAEEGDHSGQPPSQRPAYETSSGPMPPSHMQAPPPVPMQQMYYQQPPPPMMMMHNNNNNNNQQPYAPGISSPYNTTGTPPPPGSGGASSMSVTVTLPDAQSLNYTNLPPSATIASIRDRVQAEHFPTTGASRIKLKCVRTGKMLNLKQTLVSAGLREQGEVIEVSVK